MLCPNCGADVGEAIRLCDRCESEAQKSNFVDADDGQEELEAVVDAAQSEPEVIEALQNNRFWIWFLAFGVFLAILIVAILVVLNKQHSTDMASPIKPLPPGASMVPEPRVLKDGGSAFVQGRDLAFKSTLALWDPEHRIFKVRFFEDEIEGRNEANYRLSLELKPQSLDADLDPQRIVECTLHFYFRRQRYDVPCLVDPSVTGGVTPKIDFLSGALNVGENVFGELTGSAQLSEGEGLPGEEFRWNLAFNTRVFDLNGYDKSTFLFGDRGLGEALALYDARKHSITLGYFPEAVTTAERIDMRRNERLDVSTANLPKIIAQFDLAGAAKEFSSDFIPSINVQLLNDSEEIYHFSMPGGEMLPEDTYSGQLKNGAAITGVLQQHAQGVIGGVEKDINIYVPFTATVIDVSANTVDSALGTTEVAQDSIGYLRVGKGQVNFKKALGCYYPTVKRIEIGFYATELTASEITQIMSRHSFVAPVNGKRANMILSLQFAPDATEVTLDSIVDGNIYFLRDPFGGFYFPGVSERQSVPLTREKLRAGELERFAGNISAEASVRGILSGEEVIGAVGQKFVWKADFSLPLTPVANFQ